MGFIRTVLGDIEPENAGLTLAHEHTLFGWPGVEHDHRSALVYDTVLKGLTDEVEQGKQTFGLGTLVDCTTIENNRYPSLMREVSQASGVNIVCATGFFCESMGIPYHWRRQSIDEIADFFVSDVTEGIVGSDIKCGIIKASSGQDDAFPKPAPKGPHGRHMGVYEDRVFRAAARAQKRCGVPITTHIDPEDWQVCNIGLEQLELLMEEGADPTNTIIGHTFYATIDQLEAILKHGAYVQLDNVGTGWRGLDDDVAVDLMIEAINRGYIDQMLITFDRFWYQLRGDRPFTEEDPEVMERTPLDFLPGTLLPMLRERGLSDADIHTITVKNPARLLTFTGAGH
mgnify:FL=1|tara:strand:- start:459 stop:1484 length:1026 start_codon:yes stop_codon:yes gene_type:complete